MIEAGHNNISPIILSFSQFHHICCIINSVVSHFCCVPFQARDSQLREVYDELQRCRLERSECETTCERFRSDLSDARLQLNDLHTELQEMHEKGKCQQNLSLELAETREA